MKKSIMLILFIGLTYFLTGCVNTSIDSVVDPKLIHAKYDTLLILSTAKGLQGRDKIESAMSTALTEKGINSYKAVNLFPPTKKYSAGDMEKVITDKKIPAIMIIDITNLWETKGQYTTPKYGSVKRVGNSLYYDEYGGQTYTYSRPNAKIEFKIFDTKYQACAWIAEAYAKGRGHTKLQNIIDKVSTDIADKLEEDGKI